MDKRRIYAILNLWRFWVIVLYVKITKNMIVKDSERWEAPNDLKGVRRVLYLTANNRVFRNLLYVRCPNILLRMYLSVFAPREKTCEIDTKEIGEGLVIYHGYSTVIAPYKMGVNCRIWQNVTIGRRPRAGFDIDKPDIGNNVSIYTGAIIIGGIKIGDNAIIAAGSVVLEDVPSNCTVAGVPAKVVKKNE